MAVVQFGLNRKFFDYQVKRQHQQDERKKLRELISAYQGRMLEAALDWDRRATQLYEGHFDDLGPRHDERLNRDQYYYQSVVFRFMQLMAVSRRFEGEAFYIDPAIATKEDFHLLRYAKGFLWVAIHADISHEDGMPGIDHFRSDGFRPLLDACYVKHPMLPETRTKADEPVFDRQRCMALLDHATELEIQAEVDELLNFLHGIAPDEQDPRPEIQRQRRRWDRIVALHLFVLAFIKECGYRWDASDMNNRIRDAISMLLYPDNLYDQFEYWLPRLGLKRSSMTLVHQALSTAREAACEKPNRSVRHA